MVYIKTELTRFALDSARLLFVPIQLDDLPFCQKIFQNPLLMQSYADGKTLSSEAIVAMVKRWNECWKAGNLWSAFIVIEKKNAQPIGLIFVGLEAGPQVFINKPGHPEVGYIIDQQSWGKGYGNETFQRVALHYTKELMQEGMLYLGKPFEALHAFIHPTNAGSITIIEKTPFVLKEEVNINNISLKHYILEAQVLSSYIPQSVV